MKLFVVAFFVAVASAAPSAEPSAAAIPGPGPAPAPIAHAAPAATPEASAIPIVKNAPHESSVPVAAVKAAPQAASAPIADVAHVASSPVGAPEPVLAAIAEQAEQAQPASVAVPVPKQLLYAEPIPILKTPASTGKLTPLAGPLIQPISPLAYAAAGPSILAPFPAWNGLTAIPATYSIEQHGYHITY